MRVASRARLQYFLRRFPRQLWQAALERIAFIEKVQRRVCGFDVRTYRIMPTDDDIRRLTAALELIEHYEPWRMRLMRRDVRRLAFVPGRYAYFLPRTWTVAVPIDELRSRPTANIAIMIVHEATHARIARFGIYRGSADDPRIERICREEENVFLHHLAVDGYSNIAKMIRDNEALNEAARMEWMARRGPR